MIRVGLFATVMALFVGGNEPAVTAVAPGTAPGAISAPGVELQVAFTRTLGRLAVLNARIRAGDGPERTITLQMYDGEETVVALPGRPETRYRFRRRGDRVIARIER